MDSHAVYIYIFLKGVLLLETQVGHPRLNVDGRLNVLDTLTACECVNDTRQIDSVSIIENVTEQEKKNKMQFDSSALR